MSRRRIWERQRAEHQDHRLQRLSEEEIKKLVKDADAHAEEDKKRKEVIEARTRRIHLPTAWKRTSRSSATRSTREKARIEEAITKVRKTIEATTSRRSRRLRRSSPRLAQAGRSDVCQDRISAVRPRTTARCGLRSRCGCTGWRRRKGRRRGRCRFRRCEEITVRRTAGIPKGSPGLFFVDGRSSVV